MSDIKRKKGEGKLGYGYFIAAVVFLCNPYISIVDILPDFFGYCFLIAGFSKWVDICPNIAEGVRGISRLRWFTLLKLVMVLLIPVVDNTYVLVFTFGFAVIESIYLFPAIGQLFDGLEYMGTRHNGRAIYTNLKNVRFLTNFTFVIRFLFAVIPELCELSSYEYSGYVTATPQIDIADYKGVFHAINLLFGGLACIVWLINVIPYINRVKKDSAFIERVNAAYESYTELNPGMGYARSVKKIFALVIAGTAFLPNFWVDDFNVVPAFVGGLFFTLAAYLMAKHNGTTKKIVLLPVAYTLISAVSAVSALGFASKYSLKDIEYKFEAYELYNLGLVLSAAEYIALAVCAIFMAREIMKLVKRHLEPEGGSHAADVHFRDAVRSLKISAVFFAVTIAVNAGYTLIRAKVDRGWYLAVLIATVAWIFGNASALWNAHSQIEYKYM